MALKNIMTTNGSLGHKSGSTVSGGAFVVTSTASTNMKIENNGVYKSPINYTFSGGNALGFVPGTVATVVPQAIFETSQKMRLDGEFVIREDDFATMACEGELSGGGTGPVAGAIVEVASGGQTKAQLDD